MNLSKALQILGLTKDFTEEELKKQYRKLMSKYHPDRFDTKSEEIKKQAEEKAKEINAAREYLTKYLKDNPAQAAFNNTYNYKSQKTNSYSTIDIEKQKEGLKSEIKRMKNELYEVAKKSKDELLKNTSCDIIYFISKLERFLEDISTLNTYNVLKKTYYSKIYLLLIKFQNEYCKKYNITIKNRVLERYSLKILYAQLEQIRKEQKVFTVEEILDEELAKYVCYPGYTDIKELIDVIKYKLIYKNSNVRDSNETIIDEFNKRVLNEFNEYYKRLKTLNEFTALNLTNPALVSLVLELKQNIGNPEKFKYYEIKLINALADTTSQDEALYNSQYEVLYNNKDFISGKKNNYIKNNYINNNNFIKKPKFK